jgi:lipoyl(octanoyl) transferase
MSPPPLEIVRAGRVGYTEALAWQRRLAHERITGRLPHDLLVLLEHPPVVTLGRGSDRAHLLSTADIEVVEIERGGDVTYHGPGQLVGYPILDLRGYRTDLHWYLRTLEAALMHALGLLGLAAERRDGLTGVWTQGRKIASIGVHVKQWVTWHGFALNVTTDLAAFDRIVPCGLSGVVMTSIAGERRQPATDLWRQSVDAVIAGFEQAFDVGARELSEPSRSVVEASRRGKPSLSTTFLDVVPRGPRV